jgi:hypothetical protein
VWEAYKNSERDELVEHAKERKQNMWASINIMTKRINLKRGDILNEKLEYFPKVVDVVSRATSYIVAMKNQLQWSP